MKVRRLSSLIGSSINHSFLKALNQVLNCMKTTTFILAGVVFGTVAKKALQTTSVLRKNLIIEFGGEGVDVGALRSEFFGKFLSEVKKEGLLIALKFISPLQVL